MCLTSLAGKSFLDQQRGGEEREAGRICPGQSAKAEQVACT